MAIHSPPTSAPASNIASFMPFGPWSCAAIAAAAAASPPITIDPSPPSTTRPSRRGSAVASAVNMSGAARSNVFWNENQVPKDPRYI